MNLTPLYFAHGAGAGHQNNFLKQLSVEMSLVLQQPIHAVTFSYMKEQERSGKKRPPSKFTSLVSEFADLIKHENTCLVMGKSMGGRVASQLSSLPMVKGVICIGFPFYPAGKPEKHRLTFLENLTVPCLIIQGTRDRLGSLEWVTKQSLPKNVDIIWVKGADHDFKTLKKDGRNQIDTIKEITHNMTTWLDIQTTAMGVHLTVGCVTDSHQ